jgi:fructokinase
MLTQPLTSTRTPLFGGIEGGGTKFVCAIGTGPQDIRAETRFPTTTPEETLARAIDFFKQQEEKLGRLSAIGFACFGPLDPQPASPTYGHILPTPKPGWTNADVVGLQTEPIESLTENKINRSTQTEGRPQIV